MPGTLFVVATPIGNLEDVTFRALRVLREASLIAAEDTRRTATLLARHGIRTATTSFHEHNERHKLPHLLNRLASGERIALVSDAGTPGISDPGFKLIRAAIARGARIEVIPGPSAVLTALVASGFPTTSFTFLGFPPARGQDRRAWMASLAREPRTCIFFEAPHRIRATLEAVHQEIGDRRVAVARELTKLHEEIARGTIPEVLGLLTALRGEMTVVVAPPPEPAPEGRTAASDREIWMRFCQKTDSGHATRRAVIGAIAQDLGMATRAVYDAVERAKKRAPEP